MATTANNADAGLHDDDSPSPPRRAIVALQAILEAKPELFVDVVGEPRIGLPFVRGNPNQPQTPWSLRHGRVRAEIAEFVYQTTTIVMLEQEITRILCILEGKAWKDQRIDLELKQALDEEPLVEALFIFLHQPETAGRFDDSCSKLLPALTKIGRKHGVDIRSKGWPRGAAQLSYRLGQLEGLLATCGIKVTRGRRPGGTRYVEIESDFNCGGGTTAASQPPSVDNDHHPKKLRESAARDIASDPIFDRIKSLKEGS